MRIIIAGGTGLIGGALANTLADKGYDVIILTRSPEKDYGFPENVRLVGWDGKTSRGWSSYVDGAHAIVNLTGQTLAPDLPLKLRWTQARKKRIYASRIEPGKAIIEAIASAQTKPQVLIQSSAIGYYGPRGDELISEDEPPANDYLAQICQDWESSTQAAEDYGVRRAIIRTAVVLDEKQGSLPLQILPFKLFVGGPIGRGSQGYSWIHLQDEVSAIVFLIENPEAEGAFNLSAPNPVTNAEFARIAGRVLNRPSFFPLPGIIMKLIFGEASIVLLEGQKVVPGRLHEMGFNFQFPTLESALRDIYP